MKKTILLLSTLFMVTASFGWGEKGHCIIAEIAEQHLTPRTKEQVTILLGGHPMTYYASWMDNLRGDSRYQALDTWHYANIDKGETYQTAAKNPKGDVYTALVMTSNELKNKNLNDSLRTLYTKMIIHMVGDLGCPMHLGRLSDLGGNKFPVKWLGTMTNLHTLWDDKLIDAAHKWSYSEWCKNIDVQPAEQYEYMESETPLDWVNDTRKVTMMLYEDAEKNNNLSFGYMRDKLPVIEQQLILSGHRLAVTLNSIFDPKQPSTKIE